MQIFTGVPREGASNDSGVVEERNFHRWLLAIRKLYAGCLGMYTAYAVPRRFFGAPNE